MKFYLGSLLLSAGALFLIWKVVDTSHKINQMKNWDSLEATVLNVRLDKHQDPFEEDPDTYRVIISYQYKSNGQTYQGDRIGFGYFHSNMDRHFQIVEKLKYAKRIRVWVNPDEPSESAITQGWNETAVFFLFFTIMFSSIIFFSIFWEATNPVIRFLSKVFLALGISGFLFYIGRAVVGKYYDDSHIIKLENKIEVYEYMTKKEIRKAEMLKKALREGRPIKDTLRLRWDNKRDTFIEVK